MTGAVVAKARAAMAAGVAVAAAVAGVCVFSALDFAHFNILKWYWNHICGYGSVADVCFRL